MPSRVPPPLVEIYLLVEQPRPRLSHWSQALAPLDGPDAPAPAAIDAYYEAATNQAIFGLRYAASALGPARLAPILELARLAEVGVVQPAQLSEGDRRRFVTERLKRCAVHVAGQRTVAA